MSEQGEYPLDHGAGYFTAPRDAASFEPLMREPNGLMARVWLLIHARVRHAPGWARGSHGNVYLERGQCILGVREVPDQLGVSKNAAARAILEMGRLGLIQRHAGQLGSVVSVPNYGTYRDFSSGARDSTGDTLVDSSGTAPGTPLWTAPGQHRTPNERENGVTGERENGESESSRAPTREDLAPGASITASADSHPTAAMIAAPVLSGSVSGTIAEAYRLAQLHDELGQAVAKAYGASWRSLQTSGPRLWLPLFQDGATEDECRHVLHVLAAEADERARLGIRDPLCFLRSPTRRNIWAQAAALPDEESAREAVRARVAGNSNQPPPAPEPKRRARRLG